MRIIAGEFRGRKLLPPESDVTRPITDRVKQSLFDILTPRIGEAAVYDCFAGTGSMGLECLSRGAKHATFFEADRSALLRLSKNIDTLDLRPACTVIKGDLFAWFNAKPASGRTVDLIFLDPPYRLVTEQPQKLQILAERLGEHLSPDGVLLFRHDANDALSFANLNVSDVREYGGMTIEFLTVKG